MARRGEGQFVAMPLNLVRDPDLCTMARELRIPATHAIGFLAMWKELVLTKGTGAGVVKGYTAEKIAAFLAWPGRAPRLVTALKNAGYLSSRRGAFIYPGWIDTPTGYYAHRRAVDRNRKRDGRPEEEKDDRNVHGDSAEVPRNVHGASAEPPRRNGHEVTKGFHGTPPGAPQGGAADVASRLEWFEANYPKGLVNPEQCAAVLGALSDADWEHLRHALPTMAGSIRWRNKGGAPLAERFLSKRLWRTVKLSRKSTKPPRTSPPPEPPKVEDMEVNRQAFIERDRIRAELIAEGVPRRELEDRIDAELAKRAMAPMETNGIAPS